MVVDTVMRATMVVDSAMRATMVVDTVVVVTVDSVEGTVVSDRFDSEAGGGIAYCCSIPS